MVVSTIDIIYLKYSSKMVVFALTKVVRVNSISGRTQNEIQIVNQIFTEEEKIKQRV